MKHFLTPALWVIWILFVSIIVIVMEAITSPGDIPPRSSIVELLGGYDSGAISQAGDASLIIWTLERVLPAHLAICLTWRAFKAVFLR